MNDKLCAICQKPYHPRYAKELFCNGCYVAWRDDIKNKVEWVGFCISTEIGRRRQDSYMDNGVRKNVKYTWLGNKLDIDDRHRLVLRDNYRG